MSAQRTALLMAVAACLAACVVAQLPAKPFKNPGGPPFLNGPSYHWSLNTSSIVTMGITYEGNYSFAYTESGEVLTELGVYTSWECGKKKGSYVAMVELKVVDMNGEVISESTACEYGFVYPGMMLNVWSQSEDECPTTAKQVNRFLGERPATNECGVAVPDFTVGAPDSGEGDEEGSLLDALQEDLDNTP